MTISFYIEKSKARKKDGRVPVYLSLSSHFGRLRRPTSVYVSPANWDDKKCQVKNKEPFAVRLNNKLDLLSTNIRTLFSNNADVAEVEVELEILKVTKKAKADEIIGGQQAKEEITLVEFVSQMNESQKYEVSKSTLIARKNLASLVNRFDDGILLVNINSSWVVSFRNWLTTTGVINNSVNLYVSRLSAILKYALQHKYIEHLPSKLPSLKNTGSTVIYLSADELDKFERCAAGKNYHLLDSLQLAKDYFLFMCYTGVRYSDFFLLTKANLKSSDGKYAYFLEYVAKKNNTHVVCPLTTKALAIVNKYKSEDSNFLFPKVTKTKLFNNIKKHAQKAGIDSLVLDSYYVGNELIQQPTEKYKLLSAHAGRHTFATLYIAKGGNIIYLQKFLGHTSLDMTRKYVELMKPNLDDDFFGVFGV